MTNKIVKTINENRKVKSSINPKARQRSENVISTQNIGVTKSNTVTREYRSENDSFILGHVTLGRLRTNSNFEADCSNTGNHGTWNGSNIDGDQYNGGLFRDLNIGSNFNGNANDILGNVTPTVTGATLTTDKDGISDAAYLFDGTNDEINYGDVALSTTEITVAVWFRFPNTHPEDGTNWTILSKGNYYTTGDELNINLSNGGRLNASVDRNYQWSNTIDWDDGNWHFYVLRYKYDGSQTGNLWADGGAYSENMTFDGANNIPNSAHDLLVGSDPSGDFGNVTVGSFYIWDRYISDEERDLLYHSGETHYYPFASGPRLSYGTFNGSDRYIVAGDSNACLPNDNAWTIFGRFRIRNFPGSGSNGRIINAHRGSSSGSAIWLGSNDTGNFAASYHDGSGFITLYNQSISADEWHYCFFSYDGTDYTLYIDSTSTTAASATDTFNGFGSYDLHVGTFNGSGLYFDGDIDEVMTFNKVLSESERNIIINNYFVDNSAFYANCKLWLSMDNPRLGDRRGLFIQQN